MATPAGLDGAAMRLGVLAPLHDVACASLSFLRCRLPSLPANIHVVRVFVFGGILASIIVWLALPHIVVVVTTVISPRVAS